MLETEGVSESDWSHFLEEVQNDERLVYEHDEQGNGVLRLDL